MDPIFRDLGGEHLRPDTPAPEWDAQSRAFREMGPADITTDDDLAAMTLRAHPAYEPGRDVPPAAPEEYEAIDWDRERTDPRER